MRQKLTCIFWAVSLYSAGVAVEAQQGLGYRDSVQQAKNDLKRFWATSIPVSDTVDNIANYYENVPMPAEAEARSIRRRRRLLRKPCKILPDPDPGMVNPMLLLPTARYLALNADEQFYGQFAPPVRIQAPGANANAAFYGADNASPYYNNPNALAAAPKGSGAFLPPKIRDYAHPAAFGSGQGSDAAAAYPRAVQVLTMPVVVPVYTTIHDLNTQYTPMPAPNTATPSGKLPGWIGSDWFDNQGTESFTGSWTRTPTMSLSNGTYSFPTSFTGDTSSLYADAGSAASNRNAFWASLFGYTPTSAASSTTSTNTQ
jgi:hypothetical protein